ncbi:hypothetical protein BX600DRAFT_498427 [Xylariales sp. PMI_506]|nr:hypothetical protein BX600DRAFT_498427 [Xylariales sp. PMI_506]
MDEVQVGGGSISNDEGVAGRTSFAWIRPRACVRCGQSKVKCIWPSAPGVEPCKRCAKAGYRCISPTTGLRGKRDSSMRLARLEEKVDGLVSVLSANQNAYGSPHSGPPSPLINPDHAPPASTSHAEPPKSHGNRTRLGSQISSASQEQPSQLAGGTLHGRDPFPEQVEVIPSFRMTIEDAQIAINCYREHYIPQFPFVATPSPISVHALQQDKPFLFKVIIWVAAPLSSETQRNMDEWFRRYIADEMVVKRERRLELLQGLLLLISWGNNNFNLRCRVSDFIYLAMTLVEDLGLAKTPQFMNRGPYSLVSEASAATVVGGPSPKQTRSLDEIRACLGCFYVCGVISDLFRRSFPLPFTSYLGRCCDMLQTAREFNSDHFLVILVRMQRLISQSASVFSILELDDGAPRLFNESVHMAISTVRKELDVLVGYEPQRHEENLVLSVLYHSACVRLYESAIYMQASHVASNVASGANNYRTEALSNCLSSIKGAFVAYIALPLQVLRIAPFCISTHFSFIIGTASRLLFLEDPDWDVSVAQRALNFADICQQTAWRFDEANKTHAAPQAAAGLQGRERWRQQRTELNNSSGSKKAAEEGATRMTLYRDKMLWLRSWYLAKAQAAGDDENGRNSNRNDGEEVVQGDLGLTSTSMRVDSDCLAEASFWPALMNDNWSWDELGGDFV